MKTFISILRGINVGGKNKMLMADLKTLYENLAFKDIITYIQSGNIIFKTNLKLSNQELAQKIANAILKKYNFSIPVIVRTAEELENVLTTNPFLKDEKMQLEKLHITFLSEAPDALTLESLKTIDHSPDQFKIIDNNVFIHCPINYGETKLSNAFFEKKLKITATTRNWNTVNKLIELANTN